MLRLMGVLALTTAISGTGMARSLEFTDYLTVDGRLMLLGENTTAVVSCANAPLLQKKRVYLFPRRHLGVTGGLELRTDRERVIFEDDADCDRLRSWIVSDTISKEHPVKVEIEDGTIKSCDKL